MHARVATFVGGDGERLRELNEARMDAGEMELPAGMTGGLALERADGGGRLFVSFFDSAEAIAAAEERFEQMGNEIPEDVRGNRTSVDVYEVVWRAEG